jgi:hypothetical protein
MAPCGSSLRFAKLFYLAERRDALLEDVEDTWPAPFPAFAVTCLQSACQDARYLL